MKNAFINESTSFESTLCSPSKPPQENIVQKPKQIFLVNYVEDNTNLALNKKNSSSSPGKKLLKQKSSKPKKISKLKNISINNNKNIEFHLLDFDALFKSIIIDKKKSIAKRGYNITKNNRKLKLIGYKRNRFLSIKNSTNKSKNIYFYYYQ